MFLDIFDMLLDVISSVISAIDVDLFYLGSVGISLWELLLGGFTVALIFGFFLRPRMGSGLGTVGNLLRNSSASEERARQNSYENYKSNRQRNESYSSRYNQEMRSKH